MTPAERSEIIEYHLYLVRETRRRTIPNVPAAIDVEDLEAEGRLALVKAADRWDPGKGVQFRSWAITCIKCALLEHLRQEDWVPRSVRRKQRQLDAAYEALALRGVERPHLADLAAELGLDVDAAAAFIDATKVRETLSTNATVAGEDDDDPIHVATWLADPAPGPEAEAIQADEAERLWRAVGDLPEAWRDVLVAYYAEGKTLKSIACDISRSESRAHQLHKSGVEWLREMLT